MQLIDYLGLTLKSDEVLELLREYDLSVTYEVDTLHEGVPDSYIVDAKEAGFSFGFDDKQVLATIFCHVRPRDGFAAVDQSILGVPIFQTLAEVRQDSERLGVSCETKEGFALLGRVISFAKQRFADHSRHYEFSASGLDLITLMR